MFPVFSSTFIFFFKHSLSDGGLLFFKAVKIYTALNRFVLLKLVLDISAKCLKVSLIFFCARMLLCKRHFFTKFSEHFSRE